MKFLAHQVEKPWGRTEIPLIFGRTEGRRIGEVWFQPPGGAQLPLLIKYIFTSEKLSVQVHPNDEQARRHGLARGKSECWYIVEAEPGATLGLGLRSPLSAEDLRAAALDGSIEQELDWRPVTAGDFFFVPPGTIHAIGAGVALLEVQQNADVTYRLYDYGRPRELHVDRAVEVSDSSPYRGSFVGNSDAPINAVLLDGPKFSLVRANSAAALPPGLGDRLRWVVPLQGSAMTDDEQAAAGECLVAEPGVPLAIAESSLVLVAVEGSL